MQLKDWLVKDLSMPRFKFFSDEDVDSRLIKSLSDILFVSSFTTNKADALVTKL